MNATGRTSGLLRPTSLPAMTDAPVASASATTGTTKRNDAAGASTAAVPANAHHGTHAPSSALHGSMRRRANHAPTPIATAIAATKSSAFNTCNRSPAVAMVSPADCAANWKPQPIPATTQSCTNTASNTCAAPLPGARERFTAPGSERRIAMERTAFHAATTATVSALAITITSVHCSGHRTMNCPSTSPKTARAVGISPAGNRSSSARTNASPVRPMWSREYFD